MPVTPEERETLRSLAARVGEIAAAPAQEEKHERWIRHNGLRGERPMVLCYPEGAWLQCVKPEDQVCADPVLYGWEKRLRMQLFQHDHIGDDHVVEPYFNVSRHAGTTGWGVEIKQTTARDTGWDPKEIYYLHPNLDVSLQRTLNVGAYHTEPPLKNYGDIEKLTPLGFMIDEDESRRRLELADDIFGDILPVRQHGWMWLGANLTAPATRLRGMQQFMMDCLDEPEWVHRFIGFLAEGVEKHLSMLEAKGYLSTNHEGEWVGTGGVGYTDELPADGFDPDRVRLRDMWGMTETQDLTGFSPAMLDKFFLPHLRRLLARFGLNCYGCCEPLHDRVELIRSIPNLRRVSISPWCDVPKAAEGFGGDFVFSYKPNPTLLSTPRFDEQALAARIRTDLEAAKANGCHVEIVMKDLQDIQDEPRRLRRYVEIARATVDEIWN